MFFKFIPTSCSGLLETFNKFNRILHPGINFYIPFIQDIRIIDNKLKQESFNFEVKTKDNAFTELVVDVQVRIKPEDSARATYSLSEPIKQIDSYIENILRSEVPKINLEQLYESQYDLCRIVSSNLSEKMNEYGFNIENTLITKIEPDIKIKIAMNAINESESMKIVTKNRADAKYIEKIREVESRYFEKIKDAEADCETKKLEGVGISKMREEIINGYNRSVSNMSKDCNINSDKLMDFLIQMQQLDVNKVIGESTNTKIIFLNNDVQNKTLVKEGLSLKEVLFDENKK